jgi:hypothetical protein
MGGKCSTLPGVTSLPSSNSVREGHALNCPHAGFSTAAGHEKRCVVHKIGRPAAKMHGDS